MDAERIILEQLEEAELKALNLAKGIEDKNKIKNVFSILNNATLSQFAQKRNQSIPYYK